MENITKPTLADQLGNSLPIISSTARAAFVSSHFILAMGSGFAIMYLVIGAVGDSFSPVVSYILAYAGSFVWYKAIENPLRKFILFAWAYRLTSKTERATLSKNLQRTGRSSGIVTAILLMVTLSLSLLINIDVAEAVTTEQDSTKEMEQANTVTTSYDRDVELLREQVEQARARDAVAVDQAKQQAKDWISQAENSKGKQMRKLHKAGNGWASSQLKGAISRARSRGERHIATVQDNAEAPTLQAQLTNYVGTRSASRDTVATMTAGLLTMRHNQYIGTKGRRNWMLFMAICFVLIVFVYTSRLLVLACLETGEELDSNDGDGVVKVAGKMAGKLNAKLGQALNDRLSDKLVLAVVAAPVSDSPVLSQTVQDKPRQIEAKQAETVVRQRFQPETSDDSTVVIMTPDQIRLAKDRCRKYYERQFTSATKTGQANNADKYRQERTTLMGCGYVVEASGPLERRSVKVEGKAEVQTFKRLVISE